MIIFGVTKKGEVFRPSSYNLNWAVRLAGAIESSGVVTKYGARIGFSEKLKPFYQDGLWCLFVDPSLIGSEIWAAVHNFADMHELQKGLSSEELDYIGK